MPARDLYHDYVVTALVSDGWTITDDPLYLPYGGEDLYVDLAAERSPIGAEKAGQKIAVEIKSFLSRSPIRDLEDAIGQYQIYGVVLGKVEPERVLYLAVPERVYENLLTERFGRLILDSLHLRVIVFGETGRGIVRWIN